mgnify:CR=1 FL=1
MLCISIVCYSQLNRTELLAKFDSCEFYTKLYLEDSTIKALEYSQIELEISEVLDDKHLAIKSYYNLAQSFYFLNQPKIALEYLYKGIELCSEVKDKETKALFEFSLGKVYLALEKPDIVLKYAHSALQYYELTNNLPGQIVVKGNIAIAYGMLADFKKSEEVLNQVLKYFEEERDTTNIITTKINIAVMFERSNQPTESLKILESLYVYPQLTNLNKIYGNVLLLRGQSFYRLTNIDSAIYNLGVAVEHAKSYKNYHLEGISTSLLATIYNEQGNYKKAALLYRRNAEIKDSILTVEGQKRLQELEIVYQVAKKEKTIESLKEIELLNKQRIWLLSIAMLLLLIIAISAFYKVKTRIALTMLKNNMLNQRLAHEKKELTNMALHYLEIKKMITIIHSKLKDCNKIKDIDNLKIELSKLTKELGFKESLINSNENIEAYIDKTYRDFSFNLVSKYPNLSAIEKRICSLVMLNFSSKEISEILSLSYKSVNNARSKLRKKLGIPEKENMNDFLRKV